MVSPVGVFAAPVITDAAGLGVLITALGADGRRVIGPVCRDGAVVYEPVAKLSDLPQGVLDEQEAGVYRLKKTGDSRYFAHVVGPQSWKRYLFPPRQSLWSARRRGKGFEIVKDTPEPAPEYVFLGVRACELAALHIHDKVFDNGDFADPGYLARRERALIVAVNCTRAGGSCFCASMDCGPKAEQGYDLALTEIAAEGGLRILVETGSERGAAIMAGFDAPLADENDLAAARDAVRNAEEGMGRKMSQGARKALGKSLDNPRWDEIAARCLSCANCTMVCPTCFCTSTKDLTSLDGKIAERQRVWDSCFTLDFSYIHGGSIRRGTAARYRQWITHKLVHWHEQFGMSGCTGCGRCITWCPVGIDITQEARVITESFVKGG